MRPAIVADLAVARLPIAGEIQDYVSVDYKSAPRTLVGVVSMGELGRVPFSLCSRAFLPHPIFI